MLFYWKIYIKARTFSVTINCYPVEHSQAGMSRIVLLIASKVCTSPVLVVSLGGGHGDGYGVEGGGVWPCVVVGLNIV